MNEIGDLDLLLRLVEHEAPSAPPPSADDQLRRLAFEQAVKADMGYSTAPALDEDAAYRAKALYEWYVAESERRANMTELEWVKYRIEHIEQLQTDLETMRRLEAEAMALETAAEQAAG